MIYNKRDIIAIYYPNNHEEERVYIINVIFSVFLGLEFISEPSTDITKTTIFLENGKLLEIEDSFFSKIDTLNDNYLDEKNVPKVIIRFDLEQAPEKNVIGLYGKPKVDIKSNKIYCGIDLLASAFFMLTRWEEYVKKDRDTYERFPAKSSLAYQHNFLSRPIVNEYVEIIWDWLTQLGITQKRKQRNFEITNTHDIDKILLFENKSDYLTKPAKALILEKTPSSFFHHAKLALSSFSGNDPYLVFDYFMDISEKHSIKSHFFFMAAANKTKFDNGYDITSKQVSKIIKQVVDRGHVIGIHPSYNTLKNPDLLSIEINHMREISGTDVVCGRQHYLRFDLPNTWQHWDDNNMHWDSSLAYSEQEGFRCGVCYSFPVFNILTRQTLTLREKPLTIMDGTLVGAQKKSPEEAKKTIDYYIDKVKQYSGEFVFLWHNSSFEYMVWKNYRHVYEDTFRR